MPNNKSPLLALIDEEKVCYMCYQPLITLAEYKVGTHIGCISDSIHKPKQTAIPRPKYRYAQ